MKKLFRAVSLPTSLRFAVPVIFENLLTSFIGLIFSSILGGISVSSLAAAGTGNQILGFATSVFSVVTVGSSVLVALNTGRQNRAQTSKVVEHALLLAAFVSVLAALILFAASAPMIRLLMPGASERFYGEGLTYYRVMLLSLPGLAAMNVSSCVLRASGDSRSPLFCTLFSNAVQLLAAVFFVSVLKLGLVGAALAHISCRYAGGAVLLYALKQHHRNFAIDFRNLLSPRKDVLLEIARVGLPSVIDSLAVNGGYVLINSILISLGESVSSVYNVIVTLAGFTGISQAIVSVSITTISGHNIGAGDLSKARRSFVRILLLGIGFSLFLSAILLSAPHFFAGLFTKDASIQKSAAELMWLSVVFLIPAVGVNAAEPAARVGGMGKRVMLSCILCVWLVRVPLTWLFCYPLDMGVTGVYLANSLACWARFLASTVMIRSKKWGLKAI